MAGPKRNLPPSAAQQAAARPRVHLRAQMEYQGQAAQTRAANEAMIASHLRVLASLAALAQGFDHLRQVSETIAEQGVQAIATIKRTAVDEERGTEQRSADESPQELAAASSRAAFETLFENNQRNEAARLLRDPPIDSSRAVLTARLLQDPLPVDQMSRTERPPLKIEGAIQLEEQHAIQLEIKDLTLPDEIRDKLTAALKDRDKQLLKSVEAFLAKESLSRRTRDARASLGG